MASVLNRTTKEYRKSANTPDFPPADWIINPDISAVDGYPTKYWLITGDTVLLMNQAQRDAVDAAEVAAQRDSLADQLEAAQDLLAAFAVVVMREINILREQFNATTRESSQLTDTNLQPRTLAQLKNALRGVLDE